MTKPNFLGIGAQKSGTTWLYDILVKHPEVYMPHDKKEIHFFDNNYSKGREWYLKFFENVSNEKAIGEITPKYIFDKKVPSLVKKELGSNMKFIVILRNPVTRFISSYKYGRQRNNYKGSIEEFYRTSEKAYIRGLYSKQLKNWFKYFDKSQFLVLIFEEEIKNPKRTLSKLSEFLEIDKSLFDESVLSKKSNASKSIRFGWLYSRLDNFSKFLRKKGFDKIVNIVKESSILKIFESKKNDVKISPEFKEKLYGDYKDEIKSLEKLLKKDLKIWK